MTNKFLNWWLVSTYQAAQWSTMRINIKKNTSTAENKRQRAILKATMAGEGYLTEKSNKN